MSLQLFFRILKGGPGSGNWSHAGRPGRRGGSSPSRFSINPAIANLLPDKDQNLSAQEISSLRNKVFSAMGYDAKPQLVADISQYATDDKILHRGINGPDAEEYADQFRRDDLYVGDGIYGKGTYTAIGPDGAVTADTYKGLSGGAKLVMALKSDAKVTTYDAISEYQDKFNRRYDKQIKAKIDGAMDNWNAGNKAMGDRLIAQVKELESKKTTVNRMLQEPAVAAMNLGYDAIIGAQFKSDGNGDYYIILNRGALYVER